MRLLACALAASLSACTGQEPAVGISPPSDAGMPPAPAEGGGTDAGPKPPATTCAANAPFGAPNPLPAVHELDVFSDGVPSLTSDEKTIYFSRRERSDDASETIVRATRESIAMPFGPPVKVTRTDGTFTGTDAAISRDGLTLAWFVHSIDQPTPRIFFAARARVEDAFAPAGALASGVRSNADVGPRFGPDLTLYFTLIPKDQSQGFLYQASRSEKGVYGTAKPVPGLANMQPSSFIVASGGLLAYFALPGPDGSGDIFHATRATMDADWNDVTRVPELSTDGHVDVPGFVSDDRCRLYFQSDRSQGNRIWLATRKP